MQTFATVLFGSCHFPPVKITFPVPPFPSDYCSSLGFSPRTRGEVPGRQVRRIQQLHKGTSVHDLCFHLQRRTFASTVFLRLLLFHSRSAFFGKTGSSRASQFSSGYIPTTQMRCGPSPIIGSSTRSCTKHCLAMASTTASGMLHSTGQLRFNSRLSTRCSCPL